MTKIIANHQFLYQIRDKEGSKKKAKGRPINGTLNLILSNI